MTSEDGHPVAGSVQFNLTAPGPAAAAAPASPAAGSPQPAPVPTAAESGDDGAPVWPWIAGAAVVVIAGAALALRRGRT